MEDISLKLVICGRTFKMSKLAAERLAQSLLAASRVPGPVEVVVDDKETTDVTGMV